MQENLNKEKPSLLMLLPLLTFGFVVLGLVLIAATGGFHEHSYIREIVTPPTCEEAGTALLTCKRCDHQETTLIQKLGHSWKEEKIVEEASCFEEGIAIDKCENCQSERKRTIPISHNFDGRRCTTCWYLKPLPELSVGMSKSQVKSLWGEPIEINTYTDKNGTRETWWYYDNGKNIAVNFDTNGRVRSINSM